MRAEAAPFDPSVLAALPRNEIVEDCRNVSRETRATLAEAGKFGGGQIAGPFGPQFSHFGEPLPAPKMSFRMALLMAAAIAALAMLIGALR